MRSSGRCTIVSSSGKKKITLLFMAIAQLAQDIETADNKK